MRTLKSKMVLPALFLFVAISCLTRTASAQERNEEVNIIAPYQPTISDAVKTGFTPRVSSPELPERTFQFQYRDKQLFAPLTLEPIPPQRYSRLSEDELLRNYIKAGFGNYTTPYLEFYAGSLRSEKYQVTARFKHLSSKGSIKDVGPSGYSHNLAELTGKLFFNQHSLGGNIDYHRDVYHYYGFSPDSFPNREFDKDSLKQRFQNIGAGMVFASNYEDPTKFGHEITLNFYNFTDRYDTRENNINSKITLTKGFDLFRHFPAQIIGLELGVNYFSYQDTLVDANQLLFNFHPWFAFNFEQYRFKIGFNAVTEKDSASSTRVDFFPDILGEVTIVEDYLKAFVEVKGGKTINSFKSLANENPFIISTPELRNSTSPIGLGGGITGNAGGFNYFARAFYRYVKDMPLFVNDTSLVLLNRFVVIYDDVNEFSFEAGGGYEIPKTMKVMLSGIFYGYDTRNEIKAWHKPSFRVTLDGSYTFLEKYTIQAAVFLIGPAYYKTFNGNNVVTGQLSTSFDLNAGFNYQYNQYFSAFLKVNNILNQHYDLWYRYPTQGFQVMAGLGFSF